MAVAAQGYSSQMMRKLEHIWGIRVLVRTLRTLLFFLGKLYDELVLVCYVYKTLKPLDMLVVSGGGQLDDYWGGAWGYPLTLLKWAIIAQLTKTKLVILSVGVCDLHSTISRFFFRCALSLAQYRSFRDETTKCIVEDMGVRGVNHVFPDLAYSLQLQYSCLSRCDHDQNKIVVGISPISALAWTKETNDDYQRYLSILIEMIHWLIRNGYRVVLFASQVRMDNDVIKYIMNNLENDCKYDSNSLIEKEIWHLEELLHEIRNVDLVVASRLHGVLLSHILYKPVLAISYHRKVDTLMSEMCLSEYCLDINHISFENIIDKFSDLTKNRYIIESNIKEKISNYRILLNDQYYKILGK
jgi:polysaccharide pyruvyl transferase WcaK-like protein